MPRRRREFGLGRNTQRSVINRNTRAARTVSQQERDNQAAANRMSEARSQESPEQRRTRQRENALRIRQARQQTMDAHRVQNLQQQQHVRRALVRTTFVRLAFDYEPDVEYSAHSKVQIGAMDNECQYCHALKYKNEAAGICCASGKVRLPC